MQSNFQENISVWILYLHYHKSVWNKHFLRPNDIVCCQFVCSPH